MNTPGYEALMAGAGLLDLSARGRIKATGEDRARLLHAMTTNNVRDMRPGDAIYAFFLNAQGRILADVNVLCLEDHFLLDTEPETRALVLEHLDRYIIADDVTLEDTTDSTFCLGVEGPRSAEIAAGSWRAWPIASVGQTGYRVYGPIEEKPSAMSALEGAGAAPATPEEAEVARIHNFKPRFGPDISADHLPQETRQTRALHFQKGCYLGQEIVERIRSRGHVNWHLMGFRGEGHAVPTAGTKLFTGGKEAGEVTSAAAAPEDRVFGLAYVRTPYDKAGTVVGIDGRPAELFDPIF